MKMRTVAVVLFLVGRIAADAACQDTRTNPRRRLYSGHEETRTTKETQTVTSSETTSRQTIYQVFYSRTGQRPELFRARIGDVIDSKPIKFWNYGIVDEGDFNGDGSPDYFWYGGDDSGDAMYLFLSSPRGYAKVDVHETLKKAWNQRFHTKSPEWANLDEDYSIGEVAMDRSATGLLLIVTVDPGPLNALDKNTYEFQIKPSDFK